MPELDKQEVEKQIRALVKRDLPQVEVLRVEPEEGLDSTGDPSLFIKVVMKQRPSPEDFRKTWRIEDQFRSWLIARNDDQRFPYFRFLDEADERELESAED